MRDVLSNDIVGVVQQDRRDKGQGRRVRVTSEQNMQGYLPCHFLPLISLLPLLPFFPLLPVLPVYVFPLQSFGSLHLIMEDIIVLDRTKNNLASSITIVRRLKMLLDAMAQLQDKVFFFIPCSFTLRPLFSILSLLSSLFLHFLKYEQANQREYKAVANLLEAMEQLMSAFSPYRDVPCVCSHSLPPCLPPPRTT